MNVLWLTSWYPSRVHASNGDFTERQARAVAEQIPLTVLFVTKDEGLAADAEEMEKTVEGNLTVYRVYYGRSNSRRWEAMLSVRRYLALQKKYYRLIVQETGMPQVVHVHVAMKAGLLALYLRRKYKIPFVVTEHWTGYYRQSSPSVYEQHRAYRWLNRRILRRAAFFLPVSEHLGKTVRTYFVPDRVFVPVPNVVDTTLFYYQPLHTPTRVFRFIHPSYLNYQKNPEGMLEACRLAKAQGCNFELLLVGNEDKALMQKARNIGLLDTTVFFEPPVSYREVAERMQQSHALLLFSRFENLPCVVLEALCCGLPVISSDVGGIPEVIDESNGIVVPSEDVPALANAICTMVAQYERYNRAAIATFSAVRYSYESVTRQFLSVYQDSIQA